VHAAALNVPNEVGKHAVRQAHLAVLRQANQAIKISLNKLRVWKKKRAGLMLLRAANSRGEKGGWAVRR
jgi:hypothetical protein